MIRAMVEGMRPHHFVAGLIGAAFAVWLVLQSEPPATHFGERMWSAIIGALIFGWALEGIIRLWSRVLRGLLLGQGRH